MSIDWASVKAEYIAGNIGGRKLCEKHGIPYHKFRKVSEREKWTALKAQAKQEESANIVKSVAKENAKHTLKLYAVADKLLQKIEDTLDEMDALDSQSIKHFTSALKDIKDIKQHHEDDMASIKHEQTLLVYGVLACLKGLREQGCNGPVTEAINRIEKYLNETAHN